jgi:hypothetical protein
VLVYNHKRHGVFSLGNHQFYFRVKPRFPKKLSLEFHDVHLLNNLLNNLSELAEDRDVVLGQARSKLDSFDRRQLHLAIDRYGNMATRKRFKEWLNGYTPARALRFR